MLFWHSFKLLKLHRTQNHNYHGYGSAKTFVFSPLGAPPQGAPPGYAQPNQPGYAQPAQPGQPGQPMYYPPPGQQPPPGNHGNISNNNRERVSPLLEWNLTIDTVHPQGCLFTNYSLTSVTTEP